MKQYIEVRIDTDIQQVKDMLIATLSLVGYDGFEESADQLKAYTLEENFDEAEVKDIAQRFNVAYQITTIAETNWNEEWEKNFEPVVVDDFVMVRADFHPAAQGVEYEVVITPKMSFGTGHHATTHMMMKIFLNYVALSLNRKVTR